jgi:hypothetical protein
LPLATTRHVDPTHIANDHQGANRASADTVYATTTASTGRIITQKADSQTTSALAWH